MTFQVKLTAKRGQTEPKDIVIAAGSAEAQSDTISLNIDVTKLTKGDALIMLDKVKQQVHRASWPPANAGTPTPTPTPTLTAMAAAAARVRAVTGRGVLAIVSDSTAAGAGASTIVGNGSGSNAAAANGSRVNSWPHQLAAMLSTSAPALLSRSDAVFANGNMGATAGYKVYNPNVAYATAGGWGLSATPTIGDFAFQNNTNTASLTFTPEAAADSFTLGFYKGAGYGTFTVTDASGTLATIDTSAGGPAYVVQTITRAAPSTLPISIQRTGVGGAVNIGAIIPFNTLLPAFEIWNMGWSGSNTNDWTDTSNPQSAFNALASYTNIDTVMVALGLNDANDSLANATSQANLTSFANHLKAAGAEVVLAKQHAPNPTSSGYNLSTGRRAAIDAASAAAGLAAPTIDAYTGLVLVAGDLFDTVHFSAQGSNKMAAFAKAALIERSGIVAVGGTATPIPQLTLAGDTSKPEGNSGPTVYTYTVTRTGNAGAVNVPWSWAAGTTSADDYTGGVVPPGGTVAIADGAFTGTFTVSVNGDVTSETDETFSVSITAPAGYALGAVTSVTSTITNDEGVSPVTVYSDTFGLTGDGAVNAIGRASDSAASYSLVSTTGTAQVSNGRLRGNSAPVKLGVSQKSTSNNYDILFDIRLLTLASVSWSFKVTNNNSHLYAGYINGTGWAMGTYTGSVVPQDSTAFTPTLDTSYELKISVRGLVNTLYVKEAGVWVQKATYTNPTNTDKEHGPWFTGTYTGSDATAAQIESASLIQDPA